MRHTHANLIHQWAEGAVGQYYLASNRTWVDFEPWQYGISRIKPGTENGGLPPGAIFVVDNPIAAAPKPQRTQLTVLEQFAMAAMQGLVSAWGQHDVTDFDEIASDSFNIAKAMIKASVVSDE